MAIKEGLRPGGRSARVQESVHSAVRELLEEQDRSSVTVPQIATRAGVTPSTIYRRWGDLAALLADVAMARLRPDSEPADTGSLRGDLRAWGEQYRDEMSSDLGREMMRDVQCSQAP
ncbi:MAG: TetR/AcrR family transcriptional regulator, partial [Pseudomonas sp.]